MLNKESCPDCDAPAILGGGNGKCSDCHGTGSSGIFDHLAALVADTYDTETGEELRQCETCGGSCVCQTCHGEGYLD